MSEERDGPATPRGGPEAVAVLLRDRVQAGREVWLPVTGTSMWPTIRPPARVRVVDAAPPRRGEVWAYIDASRQIVVHRCQRAAGPGYLFRGDGLPAADPWVPAERVVGRVATVEDPRGRRSLGPADRAIGSGRILVRRLRSVARRGRKWVGGLMTPRRRRR
jgi:hypothetical protein